MRYVMTRVLPDPAPARMSSGPVAMQHGFALFGVQFVEEIHCGEIVHYSCRWDRTVSGIGDQGSGCRATAVETHVPRTSTFRFKAAPRRSSIRPTCSRRLRSRPRLSCRAKTLALSATWRCVASSASEPSAMRTWFKKALGRFRRMAFGDVGSESTLRTASSAPRCSKRSRRRQQLGETIAVDDQFHGCLPDVRSRKLRSSSSAPIQPPGKSLDAISLTGSRRF